MKKIIQIILRSQKTEDRNQRLLKSPFFLLLLFTLHPLLFTVIHAAEFEVVDKLLVNGRSIFKSSVTVYGKDAIPQILGLADESGNYKLVVTTSGNVGIGTTAPIYLLDVYNSGTLNARFQSGGNNDLNLYLTSGSNNAYIRNTNSLNFVVGNQRQFNFSGGTDQTNNYTQFLINGKDTASNYLIVDIQNNGTSRMAIHRNGNVGIGTTSPAYRLAVSSGAGEAGTILAISTGTSTMIELQGDGEIIAKKFTGDGSGLTGISATDNTKVAKAGDTMTGQLTLSGSTLTVIAPTSVASSLWVSTSALTPHLYVSTTGNVGIGTTAPASTLELVTGAFSTLTVDSTINTNYSVLTAQAGITETHTRVFNFAPGYSDIGYIKPSGGAVLTDGSGGLSLVAGDASGAVRFYSGGTSNAYERIRITPDGNVGIGTTAPGAKLHAVETSGTNAYVFVASTATDSASYKMVVSTTGKVGIGTTTPSQLLNVLGDYSAIHVKANNVDSWAELYLENDARLWKIRVMSSDKFSIRDNTAGKERLNIDTDGNVGIGTAQPDYRLEISSGAGEAGTILAVSTGTSTMIELQGDGEIIAKKFTGDGSGLTGISSTDNTKVAKAGDTMTGQLTLSGSTLTVIAPTSVASSLWVSTSASTPHLYVSTTGNVGIGTTAPLFNLSVGASGSGVRNSVGAAGTYLDFVKNAYYSGTAWLYSVSGDEANIIELTADGNFYFATAGTGIVNNPVTWNTRLSISNAGNVGIGTTGPGAKLHAVETSGSNSYILIASTAIDSGSYKMVVSTTGNVGIGTTEPNTMLQLGPTTDVNTGAILLFGKAQTASQTFLPRIHHASVRVPGTSNDFAIGTGSNNGSIYFYTGNVGGNSNLLGTGSNSAKVAILSSGNVGIGTTSPEELFQVGGGTLTVTSSGNVGIGTTVPGSILHINTSQTGNVVKLRNTGLAAGSLVGFEFGKANTANNMAEFRYNHVADGSSSNYINLGLWANTNTLIVQGSGNVGIGTTDPGAKLDITGNGSTVLLPRKSTTGNPAGSNGMIYYNTADSKFRCYQGGAWTDCIGAGAGDNLGNHTATQALNMSNNQIMNVSSITITGNAFSVGGSTLVVNYGNVGIGTTGPSDSKLHLYQASGAFPGGNAIKMEAGTNQNVGFSLSSNGKQWQFSKRIASEDDSFRFYHYNGTSWESAAMTLKPGGNVGIGTTGPGQKLDIQNGGLAISSWTSSGSSLFVSSTTGNVGIGTTDPGGTLHVYKDGSSNWQFLDSVVNSGVSNFVLRRARPGPAIVTSGDNIGRIRFQGYDGFDGYETAALIDVILDGSAGDGDMPGRLEFKTSPDGTATSETRMTIGSGGNVGIGTTSPGAKLDVTGDGSTVLLPRKSTAGDPASPANGMIYYNANTGKFRCYQAGAWTDCVASASGDNLGNHTATLELNMSNKAVDNVSSMTITGTGVTGSNPLFKVAGSTMVVLNNGNVGIGTTGPGENLSVVGNFNVQDSVTATKQYRFRTSGGALDLEGAGASLYLSVWSGADFTGSQYNQIIFASNGNPMNFQRGFNVTSGNVGIGEAGPDGLLEVSASGGASDLFLLSSNDNNDGDRFIVKNSGRIGIGTNNPGFKLDVSAGVGDIRVNGTGGTSTGVFFQNTNVTTRDWYVAAAGNSSSYGPPKGFFIRDETAGATHLAINTSGNVGIGTTSPAYRLAVSSGAGEAGTILAISTGTSTMIELQGDGEIIAKKFTGDGSGLTGISATDNTKVAKAGDTMTGQLTLSGSTLTVIAPTSVASSLWVSTSATTSHLYVSTTGYVGIGTTNPQETLHLYSAGSKILVETVANFGSGQGNLLLRRAAAGPSIVTNDMNLGRLIWSGYDGNSYESAARIEARVDGAPGDGDMPGIIEFATSPDGSATLETRMTIKSSGRVGIGTTGPGALLDVSSVTAARIRLTSTATSNGAGVTLGDLIFYGNDASAPGAGIKAAIRAITVASLGDDAKLTFSTSDGATNDIERMVISESGDVGIGTTGPGTNLHVRQGNSGQTPSNVGGLFVENNGASNNWYIFQTATAGGGKSFSITSAGNVGIGTTGPAYRLVVSSGAGEAGTILAVSTGTSTMIELQGDGEIIAKKFTGDGSGLTGISATDNTKVAKAGDTMTGQLTLSGSTLTVIAPTSLASSLWVSTSAATAHLYVSTTGNVGIGTTSPAVDVEIQKYNLGPNWKPTAGVSGNAWVGIVGRDAYLDIVSRNEGSWGSAIQFKEVQTDNITFVDNWGFVRQTSIGDRSLRLQYGTNVNPNNNANVMTFATSGNVGIGTTQPDYRLVVSSGAGEAGTILAVSTGTSTMIELQGDGEIIAKKFTGDGSGLTGISATDNTKVAKAGDFMTGQLTTESTITVKGNTFSVGGSTLVVSYGNVGIGTTGPDSKLHVEGTNIQSPVALVHLKMLNTSNNPILKLDQLSTGGLQTDHKGLHIDSRGDGDGLFVENAGATGLIVKNSGNVGIGTTGPTAPLHIRSSVATGLILDSVSGDVAVSMRKAGSAIGYLTMGDVVLTGAAANTMVIRSDNALEFAAGGDQRIMMLSSSGNVGIGTTNPLEKLDVAGVIRSTNTIYPGSGTGFQSSRGIYDDSLNYRTVFSSNVYIVGYSSAVKFFGDGSALTGLTGLADNLGNHTATQNLNMAGFDIINVDTITAQSQGIYLGTHVFVTQGNVGIGTTSPSDPLHISKDLGGGVGYWLLLENTQPGYMDYRIGHNGDYLAIFGGNSSGNPTTQFVTITHGGYVGIGNTSPTSRLAVSGDIEVQGNPATVKAASGNHLLIQAGDDLIFGYNNTVEVMRIQEGNVGIGTDTPKGLFQVGGGTLTATSAGNVGIGTTNPGTKLDIKYNTPNVEQKGLSFEYSSAEGIDLIYNSGGTTAAIIQSRYSDDNAKMQFRMKGDSGVTAMTILGSGNVGIGNTGPEASLHVVSTDTVSTAFKVQTGAISGTEVVVSTAGNLGIGTTNPAATLHVQSPVTQTNAVIVSTGTAANQYLVSISTAGRVNLKADGTNTGELKVGYTGASPAGYYAVYAP